jgi:hypothetical protein
MNFKITILLLMFAFGILSCKSATKIKKLDFTSKFKQLDLDSTSKDTLGVKIDFCKVMGDNWDSIYVIPPYANTKHIDSIKADNLSDIHLILQGARATEWAVHLVIIKNRKIVSYGLLSAGELDLTRLMNSDGSYYILNKNHCDKFWIKSKTCGAGLIFLALMV